MGATVYRRIPAVQRGSTKESRSWDRRINTAVQRGSTKEAEAGTAGLSSPSLLGFTEGDLHGLG
ncbi:hypothetical protein, partial [Mycolicibacter algericus]|uniref:hypothetical protein n=1 Tax=Mycolicibacter algericus TaxID=1288388 RepID=UPI003C718594